VNILKLIVSLTVSVASIFGQTKLDVKRLDCKASSATAAKVLALIPAGSGGAAMVVCVDIDSAALKLDTSVSPPVLRIIPQSSPTLPVSVDHEVPAGSIDGANLIFTLVAAPNPVSSLYLYLNGLLMRQGADFAVSGQTITFLAVSAPQNGDLLEASYKHP